MIGGVGSIELFGKSLDQYSQKDLGKFMGYVPQTREQLLPYTVYEFVLMGRYPYLNPLSRVGREDRRIVDESLSTCGIDRFSQRMVNDLSGGERQKVYLAAALAQQPKVLLLDEPTAHLDPKYHMEIQNTICQISKDMNMTVLHVTHDLNYLLHWSQKIIALKNGEVCFYGTPDEVIKGDHLHKTFDTHFLVVPHPGDKRGIIIPEVNG